MHRCGSFSTKESCSFRFTDTVHLSLSTVPGMDASGTDIRSSLSHSRMAHWPEPINPLVIHRPTFPPEQHRQSPIPEPPPLSRQAAQPCLQLCLFPRALPLIAAARARHPYQPGRSPLTQPLTRLIFGTNGFETVYITQVVFEQWRVEYNTRRPHSALVYRPPVPAAYSPMVPINPVSQPRAVCWYKKAGPISDVDSLTSIGTKSRSAQM